MSDFPIIAKQGLLFAHALLFAFALVTVLREDWRIWRSERLDVSAMHQAGTWLAGLLGGLWLTGLALVGLDVGTDVALLLAKPKLLTKLLVVSVLTLNAFALHLLVLPRWVKPPKALNATALLSVGVGTLSTVSWLFATFVGVARVVAPQWSLIEFIALYGVSLALGAGVAFTLVLPQIRHLLLQRRAELKSPHKRSNSQFHRSAGGHAAQARALNDFSTHDYPGAGPLLNDYGWPQAQEVAAAQEELAAMAHQLEATQQENDWLKARLQFAMAAARQRQPFQGSVA